MANLIATAVSHTFNNGQSWVLDTWSGSFNPHTITTITGPSGCGKSTVLHCLGGLLTPTRGDVLLHGDSLYRRTPTQRADAINQHIGFVFQRASLLPELSVWDNIAIKYRLRNAPEPSAMIDHWLTVFQLSDFRDASPATLSGGQGHRVAFIRALLNTPTVLLCDEPTGNLDENNAAGIMEKLLHYCRDHNASLICVTHNQGLAAQCAKRYALHEGILTPA